MLDTEITDVTLAGGVLRGRVTGRDVGGLEARLGDTSLGALEVQEAEGGWTFELALRAHVLNDGTQTVALVQGDRVLHALTLRAGTGAGAAVDLTAEMALLRAELDLLKAAFRRHCAETDPD